MAFISKIFQYFDAVWDPTQQYYTSLGGLWEEFLVGIFRRLYSNKNFGSKSQKKSSSDSSYIAEIGAFYLLALIYFFM